MSSSGMLPRSVTRGHRSLSKPNLNPDIFSQHTAVCQKAPSPSLFSVLIEKVYRTKPLLSAMER